MAYRSDPFGDNRLNLDTGEWSPTPREPILPLSARVAIENVVGLLYAGLVLSAAWWGVSALFL